MKGIRKSSMLFLKLFFKPEAIPNFKSFFFTESMLRISMISQKINTPVKQGWVQGGALQHSGLSGQQKYWHPGLIPSCSALNLVPS